jgi:hypothetical protein
MCTCYCENYIILCSMINERWAGNLHCEIFRWWQLICAGGLLMSWLGSVWTFRWLAGNALLCSLSYLAFQVTDKLSVAKYFLPWGWIFCVYCLAWYFQTQVTTHRDPPALDNPSGGESVRLKPRRKRQQWCCYSPIHPTTLPPETFDSTALPVKLYKKVFLFQLVSKKLTVSFFSTSCYPQFSPVIHSPKV